MGIMNKGVLYALWDYEPQNGDELPMREGDCMTVIRREDEEETEWWWARLHDKEGYVPRNLLGVSYPHRGRFYASPGCAGPHCVGLAAADLTTLCATWTFGVRTVLDLHVGEVPTSMSARSCCFTGRRKVRGECSLQMSRLLTPGSAEPADRAFSPVGFYVSLKARKTA